MLDTECAKLFLDIVPRSMRSIRTEMRLLAKSDLTLPQFRTLVRLNRSSCTNRELAEWLGVSAPTTSRMIDALVKRKLLTRNQGAGDGRQITLALTTAGAEKFGKIRAGAQAVFAKRMATLSASERTTLAEGLKVLGELFREKQ